MATPGVMLREAFNTNFTFIDDVSAAAHDIGHWTMDFSDGFEVHGAIENVETILIGTTDVADTANLPSYETTRFASMAGILANHPLRNDWLEDMGLSPDIDLDVL